jgi:hypothetical protein
LAFTKKTQHQTPHKTPQGEPHHRAPPQPPSPPPGAQPRLLRQSQCLAFTRYCHYQDCMACIAINGGRKKTICYAIVWAMKGGRGVPKHRGCLQRMLMIRARKPRLKRISCTGQEKREIDGQFRTCQPSPGPFASTSSQRSSGRWPFHAALTTAPWRVSLTWPRSKPLCQNRRKGM